MWDAYLKDGAMVEELTESTKETINRQGFSHRKADAKSLLDEAVRHGTGGASACEGL